MTRVGRFAMLAAVVTVPVGVAAVSCALAGEREPVIPHVVRIDDRAGVPGPASPAGEPGGPRLVSPQSPQPPVVLPQPQVMPPPAVGDDGGDGQRRDGSPTGGGGAGGGGDDDGDDDGGDDDGGDDDGGD